MFSYFQAAEEEAAATTVVAKGRDEQGEQEGVEGEQSEGWQLERRDALRQRLQLLSQLDAWGDSERATLACDLPPERAAGAAGISPYIAGAAAIFGGGGGGGGEGRAQMWQGYSDLQKFGAVLQRIKGVRALSRRDEFVLSEQEQLQMLVFERAHELDAARRRQLAERQLRQERRAELALRNDSISRDMRRAASTAAMLAARGRCTRNMAAARTAAAAAAAGRAGGGGGGSSNAGGAMAAAAPIGAAVEHFYPQLATATAATVDAARCHADATLAAAAAAPAAAAAAPESGGLSLYAAGQAALCEILS